MSANVTVINAAGTSYNLVPAPFISISSSSLRNKNAHFGNRYNITLNGTIVSSSPPKNGYTASQVALQDIMSTQKNLVDFFNVSGTGVQKLEITPGGNNPAITFKTRFESINFEEGTYTQTCKYTINLVSEQELTNATEQENLLEDFNETWSFEIENNLAYADVTSGNTNPLSSRSFIASRTLTATGRNLPTRSVLQSASDANATIITNPNDKPAWLQAKSFIDNSDNYNTMYTMLAKSSMNVGSFDGFNHGKTVNIDKGAGTVTQTDTWVLAPSGTTALEHYELSVSTSLDNPYVKTSIQGTIKGLAPSGFTDAQFASNTLTSSPYGQAKLHYYNISSSGSFGVGSLIYKRADNAVAETLNSQPLSVSIGANEQAGEISYNIEFDNRPSNFFSGVLYESFSINDTYPGDVFATIPVLGRPTGPILQFTFGRTEYRRDMSVEIIVDSTHLGYGTDRGSLLLKKPSINDPIANQLKTLIGIFSPANEPGIRKYFLSPPQESWNPKEGRYTLNLGWTYELSE